MNKLVVFFILFNGALVKANENASLIIGAALKYGPNGFKTEGVASSSVTNKKHTTINNTSLVEATYQVVPGVTLQSVPEVFGASLGASYFNDGTITLTVGVGL